MKDNKDEKHLKNQFNEIKLYGSFPKISTMEKEDKNSNKQKSQIENIKLNFNYFNEKNSLFSNSNDSITEKALSKNEVCADSKNTNYENNKNNNNEDSDYDIFGILSKHLIYQDKLHLSKEDNIDNNNKEESESENKNNENTYDYNNQFNDLKEGDKLILYNFIHLAKEKYSCKILQQKIKTDNYLIKYFFPLIISNINELIIHPYGNYLIQNIFCYLSENDISEFIDKIKPNILNISMNFYGTRVIQTLIDHIHNQNTMLDLLNAYSDYSIIAKDIFASHIIFKLLSLKQNYITSFIYEKINNHLVEISTNKHGCCVIKKILETSFNEKIINNIINNSLLLITDQFGHYTLLYIIQSNMRNYKLKLIQNIIPNFIQLSIQIYSSTLIEKCFEFCEDDIKVLLYQCLGNMNTIKILTCDKYGNYVVQKAILKAQNDMRFFLFRIISSVIYDIKNDIFGRQFYVKICKSYPDFKHFLLNSQKITV
jgi:hypothetical protein